MYEILKDEDIREPLFTWLEEKYGIVRFLEEKTMGKSRADIVMVCPDALYGIEIKSDADTYERLKRQVRDYDKYFDYNMVVIGIRHAEHVQEHVPAYWGIVTVEKVEAGFDFYVKREPLRNPKMKMERKISLLWRPELAAIQKKYRLPAYREKSKRFVEDKVLLKLDRDTVNVAVCDALFERDYTLIEDTIEEYRRMKKPGR
jgi:hypothetical protein